MWIVRVHRIADYCIRIISCLNFRFHSLVCSEFKELNKFLESKAVKQHFIFPLCNGQLTHLTLLHLMNHFIIIISCSATACISDYQRIAFCDCLWTTSSTPKSIIYSYRLYKNIKNEDLKYVLLACIRYNWQELWSRYLTILLYSQYQANLVSSLTNVDYTVPESVQRRQLYGLYWKLNVWKCSWTGYVIEWSFLCSPTWYPWINVCIERSRHS